MSADETVPVGGIEDGLLHFGIDLLEGIVDAVVIALFVVDGAKHHHGTFDVRRVALRVDPCNEAVALLREDDVSVLGKLFDIAVGEPPGRPDGDKAIDGCVGSDLPQDLAARSQPDGARRGDFGALLQPARGIPRDARPFVPARLAGGIVHILHGTSGARIVGVVDVAGVNGMTPIAQLSAVIDAEHGVSLPDEVHDELFVAREARLEQDEDGGKALEPERRIVTPVDLDAAVIGLSAEEVDPAHDGAFPLLFGQKFLIERKAVVKVLPERDGS